MTKKLAIAVVGCGFFAQNHLHAWKSLKSEGACLTAVCDIDEAKANAASELFGARPYTDLEQMLEQENLDLVDVATRAHTHLPIFEHLRKRGVATILQKPLAPDWATCCAIADAAVEHDGFLAVHENFRFQRPMLKLKSLVDDGVIGEPNWARFSFRTGFNVYANQPYFLNEERLVILDVGIHLLDLARVFLGEVATVSCQTQRRNPIVKGEDTASLLLRHQTGAVSIVECTFESRRMPDLFPHTRVEIEGSHGMLLLKNDDEIEITQNGNSKKEFVDNVTQDWMKPPFHVVQQSVVETSSVILKAFREKHLATTDIKDNIKTYALVEAAYAAAESGNAHAPPVWRKEQTTR